MNAISDIQVNLPAKQTESRIWKDRSDSCVGVSLAKSKGLFHGKERFDVRESRLNSNF